MRKAVKINLTLKERCQLEDIVGSSRAEVRDVFRAKIILLADKGKNNHDISAETNTSYQTVSLWRNRFDCQRLEGLKDRPGRGRKRTYDSEKVNTIVEKTLTTIPNNATHWSTRTMAEEVKVSHMTVQRIWKAY